MVGREQSLKAEIESLRQVENASRIEAAEARLHAQAEATQKTLADLTTHINAEARPLAELEAQRANAEAQLQQQVTEQQALDAQIEALGQTELLEPRHIEDKDEELKLLEEAEGRLRAQEEARHVAPARVMELAETEQRINVEVEGPQRDEVNRVTAAESRHAEIVEAQNHVEVQARRLEDEQKRLDELEAIRKECLAAAEVRAQKQLLLKVEIDELRKAEEEQLKHIEESQAELQRRKAQLPTAETSAESLSLELAYESDSKSIVPMNEEPSWIDVTLENRETRAVIPAQPEFVSVETTADLALFEPNEFHVKPTIRAIEALETADQIETSAVPVLADHLKSANSSERAAALVDLAEEGGEEAYHLIAKSFDDPSAEVRNAAARALCSFHSDVAASFTRALREASPERRRRIGGAIAGSGLAANAINNLIGEGRDQTYDAFSILFLMAKAGEVQPLIQAIGRHSNVEVRLTASKLLALSNQPQVLPALRSMAAREPLPPDVHSAVMEAIYLLSTHVHESVPSLA